MKNVLMQDHSTRDYKFATDDTAGITPIKNRFGFVGYDADGELMNMTSDSVNSLTFVGRYGGYRDWDTGLTYFWHRWYDSKDGRWMSRDPVESLNLSVGCSKNKIGQRSITNLYHYVGNNPKRWRDDVGLMGIDADAGSNNANARGNVNGEGIEVRYNYCGKNYSEGHMHLSWRDENSFNTNLYPTLNKADECCLGHDLCSHYVLNQMYNKKLAPCEYRTKTITDCNRELSNCFSKTKGVYATFGNMYFGYIDPAVGDIGSNDWRNKLRNFISSLI